MRRCAAMAFTLIEVLVVMAIIAILAALLIAVVWSSIKKKMELTVTAQRMEAILNAARTTQGEDSVGSLQSVALGRELRFASLRTILDALVSQHGLVLSTAKYNQNMPPNLGTRWERHADTFFWRRSDTALDYAIVFARRERILTGR